MIKIIHHSSQLASAITRISHYFFHPNIQQKPYLGKFQLCNQQGHFACHCITYNWWFKPSRSPQNQKNPLRANYAAPWNLSASTWLLDTHASHYVTINLETYLLIHFILGLMTFWLLMVPVFQLFSLVPLPSILPLIFSFIQCSLC